jgi:CxxC motif-containing protein
METREIICIGCPLGCNVQVELDEGGIRTITGFTCKRGETYAEKEITHPMRIVTSTIKVNHGEKPLVSVKTRYEIPKGKIFQCMKEINEIEVDAPVAAGDILIENVAETGVAVIATKDVGVENFNTCAGL